ncbi:MAG: lasso RiPP family leader peptide-containing protein [Thermoanaerobaculia bacterium]
MRYETPEVFEIGAAEDLTLGGCGCCCDCECGYRCCCGGEELQQV